MQRPCSTLKMEAAHSSTSSVKFTKLHNALFQKAVGLIVVVTSVRTSYHINSSATSCLCQQSIIFLCITYIYIYTHTHIKILQRHRPTASRISMKCLRQIPRPGWLNKQWAVPTRPDCISTRVKLIYTWYAGYETINPVRLKFIFPTENTLLLHYKDQPVSILCSENHIKYM
jgi:hypothetical protein